MLVSVYRFLEELKKAKYFILSLLLCILFISGCGENSVKEVVTEKITVKESSFAPTDLHEKMFVATQQCWGEVSSMDDYWDNTTWVIYYDGTVESYSLYNISGYTDKSIWKLSDEEFIQLTELLNGQFQKKQKIVDACDGDGWEMKYFDEAGELIHSYDGYIYGLKVMEDIEEMLNNTEGKEITQEAYIPDEDELIEEGN